MKFLSEEEKNKFTEKVMKNRGKLMNRDEILNLIAKGLTQTEIAMRYGVSRQSISKLLKKTNTSLA